MRTSPAPLALAALLALAAPPAAPALSAQQPSRPLPRAATELDQLRAELDRRQRTLAEALLFDEHAIVREQAALHALQRQIEQAGVGNWNREREALETLQRQLITERSALEAEALTRATRDAQMAYAELPRMTAELEARQRALEETFMTQAMATTPRAGAGGLASLRTQQGTPEDSLYRLARETLNRGEYSRAAQLFQSFQERFPNARTAPAALYWRAFALYRAGSTDDLRGAQAALVAQRTRYPNTAQDGDAAALQIRIHAALAARGDQQAAAALRAANAQGATCDREDMEIRTEALNALSRQDEAAAGTAIGRILAQRDECSVTLRRRAVYHLGRRTDADVATRLVDVARNDPDRSVRADAIAILGRMPGDQTVRHLEQVFTGSTDERTQTAVFTALRHLNTTDARRVLRRFVERTDLSESLRANAVNAMTAGSVVMYGSISGQGSITMSSQGTLPSGVTVTNVVPNPMQGGERAAVPFAQANAAARPTTPTTAPLSDEDAAFLRGIYARETSRAVKEAIIGGLARAGGTANDQWLMGIVRNVNEESRYRSSALTRMRAARFPIEEVNRLYDTVTDRQLRSSIITILRQREEDAATDKLVEIIRNGTDPQIRREALTALNAKKDPRSTRILLELIER